MKEKKKSFIEAWRFLAAILLLIHHGRMFDYPTPHFYMGWIYVEFFFMLTGYFTMKHFSNVEYNSFENIARSSIQYTFIKFIKFIPYTTSAIFITYLVVNKGNYNGNNIINMVLEMTLLYPGDIVLGPIWFLRVLIIVFPLFCILCQIKSKSLIYILSFLYTILYYNFTGVLHEQYFPGNIFRAIAGLLLGVLVYGISENIKRMHLHKYQEFLLNILEVVLYVIVFVLTYTNRICFLFILACMFGANIIFFSEKTYTSGFSSRVVDYFGKISMVIYIIHVPIGYILKETTIPLEYIVLIWSALSVVIAATLYYVVENMKIFVRKCNHEYDK